MVIVNAPPTVSLTSPANCATFKAPASVTLTAQAIDSDGTVTQVDFFQGNTPIASITPPTPFSFTVNNLAQGSYTFTAIATDDKGATTTSNQATITVTPAQVQLFYIYTDQLNTPRVITDQTNKVVWRWDNQAPFGANMPDEDPSNTGNHFTFNPRFPGQYFDKETNLAYNHFRDYDPAQGRYVESDPIGLAGGINTYQYGRGNPVQKIDISGLATLAVGVGGSFQQTLAGASQSYSVGISTKGKFCVTTTTCGRLGPGEAAGVGVTASVSTGDFCEGNKATIGFFAEGGEGLLGGVSIDAGSNDVSASLNLKGFIGGGAAGGSQVCVTRTKCF